MLIHNISSTASAPKHTSESAPAPTVAPKTGNVPVDLPQAAANAAPQQQPNVAPPTPAQVQSAVDSINKAMKQANANVEFTIDKDTQKTVITVVASETGEVIRQFPTDEMLAIARAIDNNMQQGLLLKQKA